jgi:hypothetical protein
MPDPVPCYLADTDATVMTPARIRPVVAAAQPRASAGDQATGEIIGIRAAFPAWNVWRSDEGAWWASRRHPLRPSQWPAGYALTVAADEARELRTLITRQPADPR